MTAAVVQTTYGNNIPNVGKPGQLAIDFATKRLYFYNVLGQPVYISQQIDAFSSVKQYAVGDIVIYDAQIWQAKNATTIPGPFAVSDWTLLTSALPGGGTTSQALRKASDSTGDVAWESLTMQIKLHNGTDVVVLPL